MTTKYLFCLIAIILAGGYSCSQTDKATSRSSSGEINFDELDMQRGKIIVESVCISCHDPKQSVEDRIAPPLEIIKRNYLSVSENEREFITRITNFVVYPNEEEALLHADVDEFGLMDPLGYSEQDIQSAAMFMYRTELERPDWLNAENSPE